jgi:hypothetical protein
MGEEFQTVRFVQNFLCIKLFNKLDFQPLASFPVQVIVNFVLVLIALAHMRLPLEPPLQKGTGLRE